MYPTHLPANSRKQVFTVPKGAVYSTETTLSNFIDNANDGDFVLVSPVDNTVFVSTAPVDQLTEGVEFYIAQKQGETVIRSLPLKKYQDNTETYSYLSPRAQETNVSINAPFTAKGQTVSILIVDESSLAEPKPRLRLTATSVTGAETATDIAAMLGNQMNGVYSYTDESNIKLEILGSIIVVVGKSGKTFFTVHVSSDIAVNQSVGTTWRIGQGSGEQAYLAERAGDDIFNHIRVTEQHEFDDFGYQTYFSKKNATYDTVSVSDIKEERKTGHTFEDYKFNYSVAMQFETDVVGTSGGANWDSIGWLLGF